MPAVKRAHWGWHQLAEVWADRLVAGASISQGDLVLDIGAGTGSLTAPLVRVGAQVIAFELHPARAAALRARFASERVIVVRADVADLRLPRRPFRVVANPPFSVTAAVLNRLVAPGSRLVRADLVVPAHVATRWAEGSVRGAGRWQRSFAARVSARVPSRAFLPPGPPAAVLTIERR